MITVSIAVLVGCLGATAAYFGADVGWGWCSFWGVLSFVLCQGVLGFLIQRKVKSEMGRVGEILSAGQKRLQQKMNRWQMRPPGSIQAAQRELHEDTKVFVREALLQADSMMRFKWWVPMLERQVATAKFQLSWMIKDFRAVDKLMPKALFIEPTMIAMKIARLYMTGADVAQLKKLYEKGVARARYNDNVLLAATMSWIEVKKGLTDDAFKTLTAALKKSDNETLKRNHECLMNNRVGHFSNSGIGDQWYSLLLEEPKIRTQRSRGGFR